MTILMTLQPLQNILTSGPPILFKGARARWRYDLKNDQADHPAHHVAQLAIPYKCAIWAAIRNVDARVLRAAYPQRVKEIPASYIDSPTFTWPAIGTALSFAFMLTSLDLNLPGFENPIPIGVPTTFGLACLYLFMNAARNFASDIIPKYTRNINEWKGRFVDVITSVKLGKATSAMFVTASAYMILSTAKLFIHNNFSDSWVEWLATIIFLPAIDGLYNSATRLVRGFPNGVAKQDFWRPFVGDVGAIASFFILNLFTDIGLEPTFGYLVVRKIFCELWSGHFEAVAKRQAKRKCRQKELEQILDLKAYQVRDPEAAAALNLVFFLADKSMAKQVFEGPFDLLAIADDKGRIHQTIKELLPNERWSAYRGKMGQTFEENLEQIKKWEAILW